MVEDPELVICWLWLFKIPSQAPGAGLGLAQPGFGSSPGFYYK